jgi:hypothetical protein
MDYYDKIIDILDKPYFKGLKSMGIDMDHYEEIFERMYDKKLDIIIKGTKMIIKDDYKVIYSENYFGEWIKQEFDDNGRIIYRETSSDGDRFKY